MFPGICPDHNASTAPPILLITTFDHCVGDSSDDVQLKLRTVDDLHSSVGLFGKSLDGLFQGLFNVRLFFYELGDEKLITHFLAEIYRYDWNACVLHICFTW